MDNKELIIIKIMANLGEIADIDSKIIRAILDEAFNGYLVEKESYDLVVSDLKEKIAYFLAAKKIDGVKLNTLYNYNLKLQHFANRVVKPASMITTHDIRYYLALLGQEKILKESTMATNFSVLKSFFSWMANEEIIDKDPMRKLKTPSLNKRDLRHALTSEELEKVRNACKTIREKSLVEFLSSSGCRLTELQQLNISDVDFNERCVEVLGKGNKKRVVYFSPRAKLFIQEYINSRKDKNPALFVSYRAPYMRLGARAIQLEIKKLGQAAKLNRKVHPHLLRHTFATLALNSGMDITVIQSILGHESVATTQIYAVMNKDHIKSEYRKLIS